MGSIRLVILKSLQSVSDKVLNPRVLSLLLTLGLLYFRSILVKQRKSFPLCGSLWEWWVLLRLRARAFKAILSTICSEGECNQHVLQVCRYWRNFFASTLLLCQTLGAWCMPVVSTWLSTRKRLIITSAAAWPELHSTYCVRLVVLVDIAVSSSRWGQ